MATNPPVHCLNCSARLGWEHAVWGIGPESRKVQISCVCGWHTTVESLSTKGVLDRIEQNAGA